MFKKSILPLAALLITLTSVTYVACQQSRSMQINNNSAQSLQNEFRKLETEFNAMKNLNAIQLNEYGQKMGCDGNSQALQVINSRNELLNNNRSRLQYHKLQMVQSDLTKRAHNLTELKAMKEDYLQMLQDKKEIQSGLNNSINNGSVE